jgi:hypothetical protein
MNLRNAPLLVLVALLLVPAVASAADYRGKTSQGRKASAHVVDGRLKLLKLSWKIPCRKEGYTWSDGTNWVDRETGPIEHEGAKFTDGGRREDQYVDGRTVTKETLEGEILDGRVKGKSTIRVRLYAKSGKRLDYCRGTIRFDIPKV